MTDLFNWLPALGTQLLWLHEGFWATVPCEFSLQSCMWGSDLTQNGLTSDRNKRRKKEICKSTVTSSEESEVGQWQVNVLYHRWEFHDFGESHTLNNPLILAVVPGPTSTGGHCPQGSVSKSVTTFLTRGHTLRGKKVDLFALTLSLFYPIGSF